MLRANPYRWWNVIAFAAMLTVNILSNALPIGGRTTQEISNQYYIYLTPAGYAFSIWSVIYILLAGFVIYQLRKDTGTRDSVLAVGIWFILSCLFNIAWLLLWHNLQIEWSVGAMLLLLLSVFIIYRKTQRILRPTTGETWLVKLPFSLYTGWVSAAFLVNLGIVIYKNGWSPFGLSQEGCSIVLLCLGAVLAAAISYPSLDSILPLVFVWAYTAIGIEHSDVEGILMTSLGLAVILVVYAIWLFLIRNRGRD